MTESADSSNPLSLLLAAPSKDAVARFFNTCFRYRHTPAEAATSRHILEFGLEPLDTAKLVAAGTELLRIVLYQSADITSSEQIAGVLPASLDPRLRSLVAGILFSGIPMWRDAAIEGRVGAPKLLESTWRVDVADSSHSVHKAGVALLELDLTIRDPPTSATAVAGERVVAVELNHAALGSLVDGMRKIRDQLASMH